MLHVARNSEFLSDGDPSALQKWALEFSEFIFDGRFLTRKNDRSPFAVHDTSCRTELAQTVVGQDKRETDVPNRTP